MAVTSKQIDDVIAKLQHEKAMKAEGLTLWEGVVDPETKNIISASLWDGVSGNPTVWAVDELDAWMKYRKMLEVDDG